MTKDFARQQMIEQQVRAWDVFDVNVLDALKEVPRELFVPEGFAALAFADSEIPIGHGQMMMTPTIEGRALQALALAGGQPRYRPVQRVGAQAELGQKRRRRLWVGEMGGDGILPPAGLGRQVTDAAPPLGRIHGLAADAVEADRTLVGIEIGDGAQQDGLSGTRRA